MYAECSPPIDSKNTTVSVYTLVKKNCGFHWKYPNFWWLNMVYQFEVFPPNVPPACFSPPSARFRWSDRSAGRQAPTAPTWPCTGCHMAAGDSNTQRLKFASICPQTSIEGFTPNSGCKIHIATVSRNMVNRQEFRLYHTWSCVIIPTNAACCPDINIEDVVLLNKIGEIAENTSYTDTQSFLV